MPSSSKQTRANLAAVAQRRRTTKSQLPSTEDIISSPILAGVCIGLCLEKGVLSLSLDESNIMRSIKFESASLFKCYVAAVGMSLLVTGLTSYVGLLRQSFLDSKARLSVPSNIGIAAIGGIIAGVGIFLAGGDLLTAFVRAGTGDSSARVALYGAAFASVVFNMLGGRLQTTQKVQETLDAKFSLPFYFVSGMSGLACFFVVLLVEAWSPYLNEFEMVSNMPRIEGYTWPLFERSWGPTLCGILIGLSQWVYMLVISEGLDLKDIFGFLVAQVTRTGLFDKDEFKTLFKKASLSPMNWLQLTFGISLYCGGWLSSWSSGLDVISASRSAQSNNAAAPAAIGGFLLMTAAQMTGLSVFGHMITGVGHLSLGSVLTTLIAWIVAYVLVMQF